MNLPNKLTVLRMILVPFFVLALLWPFPIIFWLHWCSLVRLLIPTIWTVCWHEKIIRSPISENSWTRWRIKFW